MFKEHKLYLIIKLILRVDENGNLVEVEASESVLSQMKKKEDLKKRNTNKRYKGDLR